MRRRNRSVLVAVAIAASALPWPTTVGAQATPPSTSPQDLDRRIDAYASAPPDPGRLAAPPRGLAVQARDARAGVPTLMSGHGLPAIGGVHGAQLADTFLRTLAPALGLGPRALAAARLRSLRRTAAGGTLAVYEQRVAGVTVLGARLTLLIDAQGRLIAAGGRLERALRRRVYTHGARPERSAELAIADHFGAAAASGPLRRSHTRGDSAYYEQSAAGPRWDLRGPVRIQEVLYPLPSQLVPAHYIELWVPDAGGQTALVAYVVSADDGTLLDRHSLTDFDTFEYTVYADSAAPHLVWDSAFGDTTPDLAAMPVAAVPALAPTSTVSVEGLNLNPDGASDPWLPPGATESLGNNVDAYADRNAPDGFGDGDLRAATSAPGVFGWVYDPAIAPDANDTQIQAVVTHLFFANNWLHDYFYDVGFDEAAGNAQTDNFGRGGADGDVLRAQAMDHAGRNNATMNTPRDGDSPRMQMFLYDGVRERGVEVGGETYATGSASFGPRAFDLMAPTVLMDDGVDPGSDGCSATTADLTGLVALIDRGGCLFWEKALTAQDAGAVGVIILNDRPGATSMSGTPDRPVTVPLLMVSEDDGAALRGAALGMSARMFREDAPDSAGSFDSQVIAHEWGHFLHRRLGGTCSTQQCRGQGEGWGDFLALLTQLRETDDVLGAYPMSSFSNHGTSPIYFGSRRVPYSQNRAYDALSFRHIADDEPLPDTHPLDLNRSRNSEVHNAGEIWATMMFDALLALVERSREAGAPYDFEGARRRMASYVVIGMQLAPSQPTFTEQRDALILAAIENDVADARLIAEAFAGRGAGTCSVAPPRAATTHPGVGEDSRLRPAAAIESFELVVGDRGLECDGDGRLDAGETAVLRATVRNVGVLPFAAVTLTFRAHDPAVIIDDGVELPVPELAPGEAATLERLVRIDEVPAPREVVAFTATASRRTFCDDVNASIARIVDRDIGRAELEDFEEEPPWFRAVSLDGLTEGVWAVEAGSLGDMDSVLHGVSASSRTDTAVVLPEVVASDTEALVLAFEHRFEFEAAADGSTYWDGGVIEVSTDRGASWSDVLDFVDPGYSGTLTDVAGNPLARRPAYSGDNASAPGADVVSLDFGLAFAGRSVLFRFRIGTDAASGATGWEIDDLTLTGTVAVPFPAYVRDEATCSDAPMANAGPDQTVHGGDPVFLDASGSRAPSGAELTYAWSLVSPALDLRLSAVNVVGPGFVAPSLDVDTVLTYRVRVGDGVGSDSDDVDILVLASARPPRDAGPVADADADLGEVDLPAGDGAGDGACGCSTPGQRGRPGPLGVAVALGLFMALGRRRR